MSKEIHKEWDKEWSRYQDTLVLKKLSLLMDEIKYEYLLPYLPFSGKTLEVGAGSARLSVFLSKDKFQTFVLDFSEEALRVAKNNYNIVNSKGYFVKGDAFSIPFVSDCFDVVLSAGLLEHFADPQPIVNEMARVLKKDGLFYSDIVPRKFSTLRSLDFLKILEGIKPFGKEHFEGKFSQKDIECFLKNAGFNYIEIFGGGVFPPEYIPIIHRSRIFKKYETKILYFLKPLWKKLDKTPIANILGFYYFAIGRK